MENLERLESPEGFLNLVVSNKTWRFQQLLIISGIAIPKFTSLSVLQNERK